MSRVGDCFFIWGLFAWGGTCAFLGYWFGVRRATGRLQNLLQPKEEDIAARQVGAQRAPGRRVILRRVKFKGE